ncbi:hypothetical protein [Yinghuangia seranimata]|uniref:hypothetical protein n=1 Tax=Yinghuangia seranimata TaxID=408067 RepID=UPI00248BCEFD|nr:hypothetical protein [Yinghuangia seranimata]MDI2128274.1 hypothetical protein [Yinghuangia seranimata]
MGTPSAAPTGFAVSAPPTADGTSAARPGLPSVECSRSIFWRDGLDSPDDVVVLDTVALWLGGAEPLQFDGGPYPGADGRTYAKTGLVVKAGKGAELSVPGDAPERPAIGWGGMDQPAPVVTVPACPADKTWIVYAGGFYADRPMCVPLTVRADGREAVVRVPIGTPCT